MKTSSLRALLALFALSLLAVAAYAQRSVTISTLAANLLQADQQQVSVTGEVSYVRYSHTRGDSWVHVTLQEPETRRQVSIHTKAHLIGTGVRVGQQIKVTGKFVASRTIGEIKID